MVKLFYSFNVLFFSLLTFFTSYNSDKIEFEDMTICGDSHFENYTLSSNSNNPITISKSTQSAFELDPTKAYSMPMLNQTANGKVFMTWTEKDDAQKTHFCMAFSNDNGKTFDEKKIISSGYGIANNRLMKAKVLARRNGELFAVFMNNPSATAPSSGGRGSRGGEVSFSVSKDNGNSWSAIQPVDTDPTKGLLRGFFDATLLANDEIAVAYLKDVKNSTKHEERDLRLSITKNGVFQEEKLIDPIVCDCCSISLLVDATGALNVYYRDNNDDIRDFSKMTSTDNGLTFTKPAIVFNDEWKIQGCPHNGAVSNIFGKSSLISWYTGATKETGIKLATHEGKKLLVITDPSAKNQNIISNKSISLLLWEQNQAESGVSHLLYREINNNGVSETIALDGTLNATNVTALLVDNQLIVAHEVKQTNKQNTLKISTINL